MKLIFGAPVALLAPYVGYVMIWVIAWIANGLPTTATRYWPPEIFCMTGNRLNLFCGRSPDDLSYFMLIFFFACCMLGWEAIRILMPGVNDPDQIARRKTAATPIVQGIAWSIVVLPTLIIAPHIAITLDSMPGAFTQYGWGTDALVDFARTWVAGALAMFVYAIARKSSLTA